MFVLNPSSIQYVFLFKKGFNGLLKVIGIQSEKIIIFNFR